MHRFVWDLRWPRPAVSSFTYPIAAIYHDTPIEPRGPWVLPGGYTVRLTVGGRTWSRPLTVTMDPRVKTPMADLARQHRLSLELSGGIRTDSSALQAVRALRAALRDRAGRARGDVAAAIRALEEKAAALEGTGGGGFRGGSAGGDSFSRLSGQLAGLLDQLQDADVAPRPALVDAIAERQRALETLRGRWREVIQTDLPALNRRLRPAGLEEIRLP
jgi:hypothetical protein